MRNRVPRCVQYNALDAPFIYSFRQCSFPISGLASRTTHLAAPQHGVRTGWPGRNPCVTPNRRFRIFHRVRPVGRKPPTPPPIHSCQGRAEMIQGTRNQHRILALVENPRAWKSGDSFAPFAVHTVRTRAQLLAGLRERTFDAVVLATRDAFGQRTLTEPVFTLCEDLSIVVAIDNVTADATRDIVRACTNALDLRLIALPLSFESLMSMLNRASGDPTQRILASPKRATESMLARSAVAILSGTNVRPSVAAVALRCGMSGRSLERHLLNEGAPRPAHVIQTLACLRIAWALDVWRWRPKEVAVFAGFETAAALTNFLKRHSGMTPRELATEVSFATLLALLAPSVVGNNSAGLHPTGGSALARVGANALPPAT